MTRRFSTAIALLLTTVTGFVITTYGMNNGLFGGSLDVEALASPQAQAVDTPTPVVPTPTPQVIEQVIYQDQYIQVPAPAPAAPPAAPAPAAPTRHVEENHSQPTQQSSDAGTHEEPDDHEEDDD